MVSTKDFQKAVELIGKSNRVLLTTHTRPDGDACGCIAAICETLTALGKNVKILLLSEVPAWYEFLFEQWFDRLTILSGVEGKPQILGKKTKMVRQAHHPERSRRITSVLGKNDLIVIVDTDTYNQLPGLDKYLKQSDKPILVIDHHATSDNIGTRHGGQPRQGRRPCQGACRSRNVGLIDSSAAATALIVFDLLKYAGWPITKKIAEALFVAVYTDTGRFQFDNTDSRALRVCAELLDAGVNPSILHRHLYQNFSPQRFKLMTAMLNTLELWRLVITKKNSKLKTQNLKLWNKSIYQLPIFATQHLMKNDFKQTGANLSDTENLIDECRRISTVEAAALFVELPTGQIKVSLRSWGTSMNVQKIAEKFGGGGHKMAAGANLSGPILKAKKLILAEMAERLKAVAP
jgi:phosphoesterase RecJ-like protein